MSCIKARLGHKVISFPGTPHRAFRQSVKLYDTISTYDLGYVPVISNKRTMRRIDIHLESFAHLRRPYQIEHRLELITGSCPHVKIARTVRNSPRLHGKQIRIEFV